MLRATLDLLPRLPAPRIAPAVEASDYHDPMLLNLEEQRRSFKYCEAAASVFGRTASIATLSSLPFRFPKPSSSKRAATHARRRLAHPFQQLFQHNRVIVLLVSRRIQQRDSPLAFRKMMQLLHGLGTLFAYQLLEIALAK